MFMYQVHEVLFVLMFVSFLKKTLLDEKNMLFFRHEMNPIAYSLESLDILFKISIFNFIFD